MGRNKREGEDKEETCLIILPYLPLLPTPLKNGKSVVKLLRNAFSKRVLFFPALYCCWRDFCPNSVKTTETWVRQYKFRLFLMNYTSTEVVSKSVFTFLIALLLLKCYWEALSIFTSLEVLDQGLLVILNIS
jgi:hypothetical protein